VLEAILQPLIEWVTATIGDYGLFAVFGLMLLESTGVLIPSEAISPFAGYLVSQEKLSMFGAVSAGVLGNLVGSWIAYFVGLRGGRRLWLRYGRYLGVRAHHLALAEKWFARYGEPAVFVSRCLPVVRTFVSFPAGTARMNFARFSAYAAENQPRRAPSRLRRDDQAQTFYTGYVVPTLWGVLAGSDSGCGHLAPANTHDLLRLAEELLRGAEGWALGDRRNYWSPELT
jgi:membrane protein DedA with SNARE-associated domain